MGASIGRNTRVEVVKTVGDEIPITNVTAANPAVVTYTGSTAPVNGDYVIVGDVSDGMVQIGGQIARVANASASPKTFELESLDASGYAAWSGTATFVIISAWSTLGVARSVNAGGASANKIDNTTLIDDEKQYLLGQNESPELTIDMRSDPLTEAALLVEAAARSGDGLGFRILMSNLSRRLFRGYVSLPSESIPLGELVTGSFNVTQIRRRLAYAT